MLTSLNDIEIIGDKQLGEGAFSRVLKCRRRADGRLYALKIVDLRRLSSADRENLKSELRLHQTINDANIVRFYDCLQIDNLVYSLLEFAANGCLFFYVNCQSGLPESLALRFLYQTALAVDRLHARQIAHRDIKPENILFDEQFNVKLCDFGWAASVAGRAQRRSVCGTYEYMSPEVAYARPHDTKTDIWCLGILLYEMLHGRSPFRAESLEAMRRELVEKRIEISAALSPPTKALLKALLVSDPARRPTAREVLAHAALAGFATPLRPLSESERALLASTFLRNTRGGEAMHVPDVVARQRARESAERPTPSSFARRSQVEHVAPRPQTRIHATKSQIAFAPSPPPARARSNEPTVRVAPRLAAVESRVVARAPKQAVIVLGEPARAANAALPGRPSADAPRRADGRPVQWRSVRGELLEQLTGARPAASLPAAQPLRVCYTPTTRLAPPFGLYASAAPIALRAPIAAFFSTATLTQSRSRALICSEQFR